MVEKRDGIGTRQKKKRNRNKSLSVKADYTREVSEMQKQKRGRVIGALILTASLCISGMIPVLSSYAVNTVNINEKCTLVVTTENDELKNAEIALKLYRVANMKEDGTVEKLEKGAFSGVDVSVYKSDATTDELKALAEEFKKAAEPGEAVEQEAVPKPDKSFTMEEEKAEIKVEGLQTGLYLLLADTVSYGTYEYQFSPILITLPTTEEVKDPYDKDHKLYNLVYDAKATLKPEKVDLFAQLRITKKLEDYRIDVDADGSPVPELLPASFIFEIKAEKEGKIVYSNVTSLKYDPEAGWNAGSASTVLEKIPAGADVTVTEVYSGASYEMVAGTTVKTTEYDEGGKIKEESDRSSGNEPIITSIGAYPKYEYEVVFSNTYDGGQRKGISVINEYEYNENAEMPAWTYQGSQKSGMEDSDTE